MTVKLENVSKHVGAERYIDDISIELSADALNVLIGPTLSGKTTLMRLLAGLDRPTAGRVYEDGRDVTGVPVRRRDVAMVYQQFINYPNFTVYDNIASPLNRKGLPRAEVDVRVRSTAEMMRISDLLNRLPGELSGGQQQRTAIARALVKDSKLLLMDEPLVNLDYKLREGLRTEMQEVFHRARTVVVYATTEPLEALMLGGWAAVLHEGRLLQFGPTHDVYHQPTSITSAQNFSDPPMNIINGRIADGICTLVGDIRFPAVAHMADLAGEFRFGVRANHLSIVPGPSGEVIVPATVQLAEVNGSETFVHASYNGSSCVVQAEGVHSLDIGEGVSIYLHPLDLFVFDARGTLVAAPSQAEVAIRRRRYHG